METSNEDRVYHEVFQYLLCGEYPAGAEKSDKATIRKRAKRFSLQGGKVLMYKDKKNGRDILREVITDENRKLQILEACHDDRVSGCHFGRDRTIDKVVTRFYWKRIYSDVEQWVKHCEVCQKSKRKFDKPAAALHPIPVSDVWHTIGIDLIELPLSCNGNKYCITLIDYFSKWAEAQPVPTKDAVNVAQFLFKTFMRLGCPKEIISDQGKEFCNQLVDRLEVLTGFKHKVTSAYHPQSNGLDERLNQTLKSSLQKIVSDQQHNWDEHIDSVLFAYRTSPQKSTKYSPFYLMYNRQARLPLDVNNLSECDTSSMRIEDKIEVLAKARHAVMGDVKKNIEAAQEKMKTYYDKKHNIGTSLKVGDLVLAQNCKNNGRKGGKLDVQFTGPYIIAKDLGKGRWSLKNCQTDILLKKTFNTSKLKKWLTPNKSGEKAESEECSAPPPKKIKFNEFQGTESHQEDLSESKEDDYSAQEEEFSECEKDCVEISDLEEGKCKDKDAESNVFGNKFSEDKVDAVESKVFEDKRRNSEVNNHSELIIDGEKQDDELKILSVLQPNLKDCEFGGIANT